MNERLRKLRKFLDLTQQEFADKIGMKRNTIANYESNRNEPSNSVISLICREFNVNEEWLRIGKGEMFNQIDKDEELMRWAGRILSDSDESFRKRFVNMLRRLNENDWETLEKIAIMLFEEK